MIHPIANLIFLVLLAVSVGLFVEDLEANWNKIVAALRGESVR